MDHLPEHKPQGVREPIERVGGRLAYLPPYSPDFNPIETVFAKLEALLQKAPARTIPELWHGIAEALPQLTPTECANYFIAAGYESD